MGRENLELKRLEGRTRKPKLHHANASWCKGRTRGMKPRRQGSDRRGRPKAPGKHSEAVIGMGRAAGEALFTKAPAIRCLRVLGKVFRVVSLWF